MNEISRPDIQLQLNLLQSYNKDEDEKPEKTNDERGVGSLKSLTQSLSATVLQMISKGQQAKNEAKKLMSSKKNQETTEEDIKVSDPKSQKWISLVDQLLQRCLKMCEVLVLALFLILPQSMN